MCCRPAAPYPAQLKPCNCLLYRRLNVWCGNCLYGYVPNTQLKEISEHFQLVSLPNPTNVLTRHAFMVNGMDSGAAELAQSFRTEILKSKQSKAS